MSWTGKGQRTSEKKWEVFKRRRNGKNQRGFEREDKWLKKIEIMRREMLEDFAQFC